MLGSEDLPQLGPSFDYECQNYSNLQFQLSVTFYYMRYDQIKYFDILKYPLWDKFIFLTKSSGDLSSPFILLISLHQSKQFVEDRKPH